jgi:hypothetical protein
MFSAALKKVGYAQNMHFTRPDQIFLVRGRDTSGERAWYYVMVDRAKRDVFKSRAGVAFMNLGDYGRVLYSGFGENPPDDIVEHMRDEYGYTE